jgi:hypothetical protein
MRFLLAILFLLPGAGWSLWAQDLTGQWTGGSADNLSDKKQKIVLNIAAGDSLFGGVLHWYFPETQRIRHYMVGGRFHSRDSVLSFMEDSVAGGRLSIPGPVDSKDPGLSGIYTLRYKRVNHKEVLEGRWSSPMKDNTGNSQGMSIRLEKEAPPFIPFVPLPHKKKDSAQQKLLTGLQARQSTTVATIPVREQDSIRIQLYDNGEIDGDSVSLYLNNDLILTHVKLQAQPKTLWIVIDKSLPVNKLILFAENLGRLPPNTALMEVTVKGKIYNIFLSTDYKHNATVEFSLTE